VRLVEISFDVKSETRRDALRHAETRYHVQRLIETLWD
jgi:hypothetical protein